MSLRRLLLPALAVAGLVLAAPSVQAQDTESGSEAWNGSSLTLMPLSDPGTYEATAVFQRSPNRTVRIEIATSDGPPCAPAPVSSVPASTPTQLVANLSFACNGTYEITATARTTQNDVLAEDIATRGTTIAVSMPAPDVTGVSATGGGRAITIVWDDMRPAAIDLSGYLVERRIGDGDFEQVASLSSEETTFVDSELPADAGEATYRVASTRPSPEGRMTSRATSSDATPFIADPTAPDDGDGTTPGATPGTTPDGGGADPGTTPGGGTTPGTTPGTAPGGTAPGSGVRTPRLGISGSFLPPLLRPSLTLEVPPEADDGFEEELPYGEPGDDDPVLPDDEMAALVDEDSAGRGMVIPIATALVLAVWAFHLRRLARAAAPVD